MIYNEIAQTGRFEGEVYYLPQNGQGFWIKKGDQASGHDVL